MKNKTLNEEEQNLIKFIKQWSNLKVELKEIRKWQEIQIKPQDIKTLASLTKHTNH